MEDFGDIVSSIRNVHIEEGPEMWNKPQGTHEKELN